LTDILHLFAQNSLAAAYRDPCRCRSAAGPDVTYRDLPAAFRNGARGIGICIRLRGSGMPCRSNLIVSRSPGTNGEWGLSSFADGGYRNPCLWLSTAGPGRADHGPARFIGKRAMGNFVRVAWYAAPRLDAPGHARQLFRADAFASWAGRRLPTE